MKSPQIDLDLCEGHGRCYRLAPSAFRPIDDLGRSEVIAEVDASDPTTSAQVDRAMNACPETAISWRNVADR